MEEKTIKGGAFQVARQLFSSDIWLKKPSSWKVIWIYILGQVNHQDNGAFKRGEGFFNLTEERRRIGNDITYDMIRHSMTYFRKCKMIRTTRSTRGVVIEVLNYNTYQSLDNFTKHKSKHKQSTREAQEKHNESTPINKNDKNDKNDNKNTIKKIKSEKKENLEELDFSNSDLLGNLKKSNSDLKAIERKAPPFIPLVPPSSSETAFADFWKAYPKKVGKRIAKKSYEKQCKEKGVTSAISTAIEKYKQLWKQQKTKKQFIPHASTWLNGQRWKDEIEIGASQTYLANNRPADTYVNRFHK